MIVIELCHKCCGSGGWAVKDYIANNKLKRGDYKYSSYSIFQCRDLKLDQKYKFDLKSLNTTSYLIVDGKITPVPNSRPKPLEAKDLKIVPLVK